MNGDALRHPIKNARGLGASRAGLHHWWVQRVTAVALIPLTLWFVWHATWLFSADHASAHAFLAGTWNAVLMILFATCLLHHSYLGLQVVVEDYVGSEVRKLSTLAVLKAVHVLLAVAAVLAVLKIAVGGTP